MPDLSTKIHLNMLAGARGRGLTESKPYGLHWGDPEEKAHLRFVRDNWCAPYVKPASVVVEIGPGGGRWTRYLLGCNTLYTVDYHAEMLDELKRNYPVPHLHTVANNGTDLPGIADQSVDFVFSFGVFVHLDAPIIAGYLEEIARVLKRDGTAVIQYSDKSKPVPAKNDGFASTTPAQMRRMVMDAGFLILEENLTILQNSALIRFTRPSCEDLFVTQTYTSA